jgi:general secretion pathway protein G
LIKGGKVLTARDHRVQGFTLIELMIVIAIIGLLTYMVAPRLIGVMGKAKPKIAAADIANLSTALDLFYLDVGRYPTNEEGLRALFEKPGDLELWAGPYLKKGNPKDPWGREYQYKSPGDHGTYDIWSYGADGQPGGEGENQDITSWK